MQVNIQAPTIELRDFELAFAPGEKLFDQLNLIIPGGRFTCLLGPSGLGKTTLLRAIAGLIEPEYMNDGIVLTPKLDPSAHLAYLPQSDQLLPWLSVLENVLFSHRVIGKPVSKALRERAIFLLTTLGLEAVIHQKPDILSGGMRQRAALARVLIQNKPIVLMDEPFASLDAITRLKVQTLAAQLLEGKTVLLVTHDPLEALRLGHTVCVLSNREGDALEHLIPPGLPPRDPDCPELLKLQGNLLQRLQQIIVPEGGG